MTAQVRPSTSPEAASTEAKRHCLACGYNLYGLGDEPRCPECGLLNIPEAMRQQVWELVDSNTRFFSGMFGPLQRRPPGWWWALDRKDDVRKSVVAAAQNMLIAAGIILTAAMIANAYVVLMTTHLSSFRTGDVSGKPVQEDVAVWPIGIAHTRAEDPTLIPQPQWEELYGPGRTVVQRVSRGLVFAPSWHCLAWGAGLFSWALLLWAGPALAGLCTQIRKGLPDFARAPRTIIAAANYESHRVIYTSLFIAFCLGVELAVRWTVRYSPGGLVLHGVLILCLAVATGAFGAAGWIGPLRSDYTKQLVRSRLHLTRIIIMYAIILPWAFTVGIVALIGLRFQ